MDISSFSHGSSQLLKSFEQMGVSQGAELKSLGPSGEPSQELIKEFEEALQNDEVKNDIHLDDTQLDIDTQKVENVHFEEGQNSFATIQAQQDIYQIDKTNPAAPINPTDNINPIENVTKTHELQSLNHSFFQVDTVQEHSIIDVNRTTETTINEKSIESNPAMQELESQEVKTQDIETQDYIKELQEIMNNLNNNTISPELLYRAQYISSMFSIHASSGTKVSQQAEQALESVLKQQ